MPVVPIRPDAQPTQAPQSLAPPPDTYLLMAAAQMHKEGRLVQPVSSLEETTREGILGGVNQGDQEWEAQAPHLDQQYDPSEPEQPDVTEDIMRRLHPNSVYDNVPETRI